MNAGQPEFRQEIKPESRAADIARAARMETSQETRTMTFRWRAPLAALAAAVLALPTAAWAQNTIQSITSTQQAGTEVVRIELSEALAAVPSGFSIQQPPRIAIDLPGVGNAMGRSSVDINVGNLRSVNVAQSGDRTRLVLNLKSASGYRAQLQGKTLLLVLDTAGGGAPPPAVASAGAAATQFAPAQNATPQSLREIDFRRGADGAGRVIVNLPSNQVGVDIRQQGQTLAKRRVHLRKSECHHDRIRHKQYF